MSILLAYLFYFFASTLAPLQRRWLSVHKDGENTGQIDFAFKVMSILVLFGSLFPLIEPFHLTGNPIILASLGVMCGIFGAGFWIFAYLAQKHVDAGITTLVSNIYTPITIILASIFLRETLTVNQVIGTILLLISIFIISKKHQIKRFHFDRYFLMMVLSGVCVGVLLIPERALQKMTGFSGGTLISWWGQWAGIGVVRLFTKERSKHTAKDTAITGIFRFLSAFSWVFLVYVVGNLSVVSAVTTFKIVTVFVAAAIFLNEREDLPRKVIGSAIAVAGLMLMG